MADLLIKLGLVLFFIGLISGLLIPVVKNPRMGLTSHLEGTQNGMLLIILGLIWPMLDLARGWEVSALVLSSYAAYMNWFATFLAGYWGAGRQLLPIATGSHEGTAAQEAIITTMLITTGVTLLIAIPIVFVGLL